jgi:hypothetical protein
VAKDAARAWLRLVEECRQDGFLRFSIPEESLTVVSLPNGDRQVTGKAQVIPQGVNQGEISASLTFRRSGLIGRIPRLMLADSDAVRT